MHTHSIQEGSMAAKIKVGTLGNVLAINRPRLTALISFGLALGVFTRPANADIWTGAGQAPINQTRLWTNAANWQNKVLPPSNDQNVFGPLGEGTITLTTNRSAGAMVFSDFSYPTIAAGIAGRLIMVDSASGSSFIQMGEGVRDTYGSDYFTAGPRFNTRVTINNSTTFSMNLGNLSGNGSNAAMMFTRQFLNPNNNTIAYTGYGAGTSLWISSSSLLGGDEPGDIIVAPGAGSGANGYTLHLVDYGRLDGATIELRSSACYLGLHDSSGLAYSNSVKSYGGNVFADRSYQTSDSNLSVNVVANLVGTVTVYQGTTNFGSTGRFGRTNNGYSIRLDNLDWEVEDPPPDSVTLNVNNGNLTEDRGGSRYVSGANRLQEAHNYTYVGNLSENSSLVPFIKGGSGVLAVENVNYSGQWFTSPQVNAGVLRLGTPTAPQTAPSVILNTPNAGVGIAWDTPIDLTISPNVPFNIIPGGSVTGQSGAVDIDKWNYAASLINTNIGPLPNPINYLRVASSMGADASFDPQPQSAKHASTVWGTQIVPYVIGPYYCNIYYFGGGGGTLRVDSQLINYQEKNTMFEMGTTGTLLPGRVALNPGGELYEINNTFTGGTDICAGTLQLMKQGSVWGSLWVCVWTYDMNITNGLYANPGSYHYPKWEGNGNYTFNGPGQLLLDPGKNTVQDDWSLEWYLANGGGSLLNSLFLDGGVVGWTGNVTLRGVPGTYGFAPYSNLNPNAITNVNVLGLGGEYSLGTMTTTFQITDNFPQTGVQIPVLLYKAGKNSVLDLRQTPTAGNSYTGGTIIAGGEIIVSNSTQLNAHAGSNGGPICILNGGRLRVIGTADTSFFAPIMINTNGTPDLVKDCGSVIEVDAGFTATLSANFDFSWAPTRYLEKEGYGTLIYNAPAPPAVPQGQGQANAWGLKLTKGLVTTNQMPVNSGADSGPVIFNSGDLRVMQAPAGTPTGDPAYGFRNIVSMKGTTSIVTVEDAAIFSAHGYVPSEILGAVHFQGAGDDSPNNNLVYLSRAMAPAVNPPTPGDYSRGDGTMIFQGVMVYMAGGGQGNVLNVLPQDAGFKLQLVDGVFFNASRQNNVYGEVQFSNSIPADPNKWIKIDGQESTPIGIVPDTWTIYGTGYTYWSGTTEKVGPGTVAIKRSLGTPVTVSTNVILKISGGTLEAGGTADPFTDTITSAYLDINNNSTATGLLISQGIKNVDNLTGTGDTTISGPAGTELIATSVIQNAITLGPGCTLTIRTLPGGPSAGGDISPVPEPAIWLTLMIAATSFSIWRARCRQNTFIAKNIPETSKPMDRDPWAYLSQ
jgi:hypothetical protein